MRKLIICSRVMPWSRGLPDAATERRNSNRCCCRRGCRRPCRSRRRWRGWSRSNGARWPPKPRLLLRSEPAWAVGL